MDILIGLATKQEVILITSKALSRGVSILKSDDDKVNVLNTHTAMAFSGEPGDTINFTEVIKANVQLYGLRHNHDMSSHAVASYARTELAGSLRTRKPFQVNILIGGREDDKPMLRWIDYLGANVSLPYAAHGYASYYILATLDRYWHPELTLEEGIELANRCIEELQGRLPIDFKGCRAHVVDAAGVHEAQLAPAAAA